MFTDISGYTALMQKDEHEAVSIRAIHREHFVKITEKYQGRILQYYGDGTLSIFRSAKEAVKCGVELQQTYQSTGRVPVRIGIHSGEIVVDEDEIIGDAVNVASRVESIAAIGSVLISEKIYNEIKNHKDVKMKFLGKYDFKNVQEPLGVYAIVEDGLNVPDRDELAGLVKDAYRFLELPSYPNAFIGRAHHVISLKHLLLQETTRLVTLLGPGGMGKTRLASKVGEAVAEAFTNGVCFVALDMINDHLHVPRQIGTLLGLKESFENSWIEEIINFLADKKMLMILDNLEQILESTLFISKLLLSCPDIKILATSREILRLPEEIEYPLDSLNRPNPLLFPGPTELLQFEAIDLFVRRAKSVVPSFVLSEENVKPVVGITDLLEGLPLPIELAAARLKLFSPQLLLDKLSTDSTLLKTKSQNISFRHQTIRNTVKWSYDLLDPGEQGIFQRISLFRGGFSLDTLAAICPDVEVLDVVESFMDKSLLTKLPEIHLVPRFGILKIIRDYGLERLVDNPDHFEINEKFAHYFLSFVEEGKNKLKGTEQQKWMALFDVEYENMKSALSWLTINQPELAGKLGADLWYYHVHRGLLNEGLEMVEALMLVSTVDNEVMIGLLDGAGSLSQNLGNYSKAKDCFEKVLLLSKNLDKWSEIGRAYNNLSWSEWRMGNYKKAIAYATEASEIFRRIDEPLGEAQAISNLAWTHHYRGQFDLSVSLQRKVLEIQQNAGNKYGVAFSMINQARSLMKQGHKDDSAQLILESSQQFEELKNQQLVAFSDLVSAEWQLEFGASQTAQSMLQEKVLPVFERIGDIFGIATSHNILGRINLKEEGLNASEFHLRRSLSLFVNSSDKYGEALASLSLCQYNFAIEDLAAASSNLVRCLELAAQMEAIEILMNGHLQGCICTADRETIKAIQHLVVADYYAQELGEFQYHQFRLVNQNQINRLKQKLSSLDHLQKENLFESPWQFSEDFLSKSIVNENWSERLSKLFAETYHSTESIVSTAQYSASNHYLNQETIYEDDVVKSVRAIIETNLSDPHFTIKVLCHQIGISHSQLHRKLRSATGLPISKFIRIVRLERAKELLQDPRPTVAAVAYDIGFKDPDYFFRVFKKAFGMTPNTYRQTFKSH